LVKFDKSFMKKKKIAKNMELVSPYNFWQSFTPKKGGSYTYSLRVGWIVCLLLGVRSLHSQWRRHKYTSCFMGGIFTNTRCLPQTPKKQFWVLYGSWMWFPLFCHHMITTTKQSSCIWSWTPNVCNCHKLFESQEKTQKINQKKEKKI